MPHHIAFIAIIIKIITFQVHIDGVMPVYNLVNSKKELFPTVNNIIRNLERY